MERGTDDQRDDEPDDRRADEAATAEIVRAVAAADRRSAGWVVRGALAVVALEVVVLAIADLATAGDSTEAHDARHLGAFSAAYGVALLTIVVRPARARVLLPVTVVLAGALVITAAVDLGRGAIPLVGEATHLPELLSVPLVWLVAARRPARHADAARHVRADHLRVVGGERRRPTISDAPRP